MVKRFVNDPANPASLGNNSVQTINADRQGNIWIGTHGGGLQLLDKNKGTFISYRHDPKNSSSLGNDLVINIYEDRK